MQNYTSLFTSYHWFSLWSLIQEDMYNQNLNAADNITINSIHIFLLVALWKDYNEAQRLLSEHKISINEPLNYFFITLTYIYVGDVKKIKELRKKSPRQTPLWMINYLEIEYLGRSLNEEKQIAYVNKIIKNNFVEDYIKIALYQSLNHKLSKKIYLKNFLNSCHLLQSNSPLDIQLCKLINKAMVISYPTDDNPLSLRLYTEYLFIIADVTEAQKFYELLIHNKILSLDIVNNWLLLFSSLPNGIEELHSRVEYILEKVPNTPDMKGIVITYQLIQMWVNANYVGAYNTIIKYKEFGDLQQTYSTKSLKIFFSYILDLCKSWQYNRELYHNENRYSKLIVFGESHSLPLSNIYFNLSSNLFKGCSSFLMGIKMYHLSNPSSSYHANCLIEHFKFIEDNANLMFTIGEIDIRPDEGIWLAVQKKGLNIDAVINETVGGYIEFLVAHLQNKSLGSITIQGIPAPAYELTGDKDPKDRNSYLNMIKKVNEKLKDLTLQNSWNFLDVYAATVDDNGISNKQWHLDSTHIKPNFYTQADKWLIK